MTGISPINTLAGPAAPAVTTPAVAASQHDGETDPKILEAAKGFEGLFMSMLVNEMFKGTPMTEGNSIYSGLMTQTFGDAMASSGGFGLAAQLAAQMGGKA